MREIGFDSASKNVAKRGRMEEEGNGGGGEWGHGIEGECVQAKGRMEGIKMKSRKEEGNEFRWDGWMDEFRANKQCILRENWPNPNANWLRSLKDNVLDGQNDGIKKESREKCSK